MSQAKEKTNPQRTLEAAQGVSSTEHTIPIGPWAVPYLSPRLSELKAAQKLQEGNDLEAFVGLIHKMVVRRMGERAPDLATFEDEVGLEEANRFLSLTINPSGAGDTPN